MFNILESKHNNKTLWGLAISGFFGSTSSMMVISLLPIALKYKFGMSYIDLGNLEGIAMGSYFLMKSFSGILSDKLKNRTLLIGIGTFLTIIPKFMFGFSSSIQNMCVSRICDRTFKSIANSPTDALIADISPKEIRGKAYGLHLAFTICGMATGCCLASLIIYLFPYQYNNVFYASIIPGMLSLLTLIFTVRESDGS